MSDEPKYALVWVETGEYLHRWDGDTAHWGKSAKRAITMDRSTARRLAGKWNLNVKKPQVRVVPAPT